jgi:hypothetical protein
MYRQTTNNKNRNAFNPFVPNGSSFTQTSTVHEAVVVDVIVNDTHEAYGADGYNVGAIQFRFLKSNAFREQGNLSWALPLDSNISEYPLLNEVVFIIASLNRFYYTKKINTAQTVTAQPMFGLNEELSAIPNSKKTINQYQASVATPKKDDPSSENKLGEYFERLPKVKRLRHDEGDIIYEGRSGHSIRFGTAWKKGTNFISQLDQSPNLLLRVGPTPDSGSSALTVENVNTDASSLWLVSDQTVPLKLSTVGTAIHGASVKDFPKKLDGSQIVINTARFVVNTKTDKILGHSYLGIHWTTLKDFTVDAAQDHLSRIDRNQYMKIGGYYEAAVTQRYSVISPKIYLGSQNDETSPVPLGDLLAKFLQTFIDLHIKNAPKHVITPTGPGILNPQILQGLLQLKADVAKGALASFNSLVVYAVKNKH